MSNTSQVGESKILALHIGISGFPDGSAAVNKCMAVYKSLLIQGIDFLIINNRAFHRNDRPVKIELKGNYDGLEYCYTSPSPYKSNSFFGRRSSNFIGRIREFALLVKLGRQKKVRVVFYYPTNGSFLELFYYRTLSKIFSFKIIAHYVEFRTSFSHAGHPIEYIADRLYDKYFMRWVDAVLPISEFLATHLHTRGFKGSILKIPPLADYNQFESLALDKSVKYFFYVGSATYMETIELVLKSFDKIETGDWELHLLVSGDAKQMMEFRNKVRAINKVDKVKCFSNLNYHDLIRKYMDASALLIPLKGSIQDIARFPQKIAEYLASGNPVITTNFGEVPNYLQDGMSACICSDYTIDTYSEKMKFVIENPDMANVIGKNGRQIGEKYFDFNSYGEQLNRLVEDLVLIKN